MADFNMPKRKTSALAQTMTDAKQPRTTKLTFLMDKELHHRLKLYSAKTGIPMSKLINQWVGSALDRVDPVQEG